jgi:hypothetical protein
MELRPLRSAVFLYDSRRGFFYAIPTILLGLDLGEGPVLSYCEQVKRNWVSAVVRGANLQAVTSGAAGPHVWIRHEYLAGAVEG